MINVKDIYAATRDGLDIILYYYPQAAECIDTKKHFKRRLDETDASACIRKYGDCWKVTDFGDTATAMSPIDICMTEESIRFAEALQLLAQRYNVSDELKRSVNKPDIQKRPAKPEEEEGKRYFELEEKITESQLRVLGPKVTAEDAKALHWYVAKSVIYIKNREATVKSTTETYPIFVRECIVPEPEKGKPDKFFKIYEPLNPDKQWRFSYLPDGAKPRRYTNGLFELSQAYSKFNADEEAIFRADPANENKPYKDKKLDKCFICSGERDALCIKALGYHPVWFNSETYQIDEKDIRQLKKYVDVIYNIPDIDSTGVRKGTELALRFLDIHTVWLPEWLKNYRDNRGKPRKDFRDFVELRPEASDFRNMLQLAMPAQFWTTKINSKTKATSMELDIDCLLYFLSLNGYHTLRDDASGVVKLIHMDGNIVSQVEEGDIKRFLKDESRKRFFSRDLRNLILTSNKLGSAAFDLIESKQIEFRNYTATSQMMFFPDCTWEITKDGITAFDKKQTDLGRFVWDTNVIGHKVRILPDMFDIEVKKDLSGEYHYDIVVKEHNSNMFRYLINTSRVHWRRELETFWEEKDYDQAEAYRNEHHFDIAGPVLDEEEIMEQKQNLINKIFAIGYNLHRYKSPSRAWAIYAMDNRIGEDGECNGRSGKSFLFNSFEHFCSTVRLSGRNPRLMDNQFVFEQVTQHTDFILVDDCDRYMQTSQFYDLITSGMTVNPKNNRSFYIQFDDSPKFGFTTNYVPNEFNPSTQARLLYMVFSDYYHEQTEENDYRESRSIRDDFKKNLLSDGYSEEEWNQEINFFAQCLRFYLKAIDDGLKIQPPMGNIIKRKYKADMGANFEDWATQYFSEGGDHLNKLLVRETVFQDFIKFANVPRWSMQKFTKALRAFCELCPYIVALNPRDLLNANGRLLRKVDDKTTEMIFVQTTEFDLTTMTDGGVAGIQMELDEKPF